MNEPIDPITPSLTLLLQLWDECTSPTWHRHLDLVCLRLALADEENQ